MWPDGVTVNGCQRGKEEKQMAKNSKSSITREMVKKFMDNVLEIVRTPGPLQEDPEEILNVLFETFESVNADALTIDEAVDFALERLAKSEAEQAELDDFDALADYIKSDEA